MRGFIVRKACRWSALLGVLILGMMAARPALAVDLVNTDDTAYDVTVEENGEVFRFTIAPRVVLSGVCSACTVRLGNGQTAAAEDNDTVTIAQGKTSIGG